jgi:hypothetical protein
MKNKPDPALLKPLNLSNEIKKRVPKSRETIPLNHSSPLVVQSCKSFDILWLNDKIANENSRFVHECL